MGLDWLPGNKPMPGHEAEHRKIVQTLLWDKLAKADHASASSRGWSRLREAFAGRSLAKTQTAALTQRYEEISVSAFETLSAPRVGFDPIADDWARKIHARRGITKPVETWLSDMRGYYVVGLVPPCDGIPFYSNAAMANYVEAFSFRAQFLKSCVSIVGRNLVESSYEVKFAPDLARYGADLLASTEAYAKANHLEVPAASPEASDSVKGQLHIVAAAGRWCRFWGERGHFLEPFY
jgi:hypothetical protein